MHLSVRFDIYYKSIESNHFYKQLSICFENSYGNFDNFTTT